MSISRNSLNNRVKQSRMVCPLYFAVACAQEGIQTCAPRTARYCIQGSLSMAILQEGIGTSGGDLYLALHPSMGIGFEV